MQRQVGSLQKFKYDSKFCQAMALQEYAEIDRYSQAISKMEVLSFQTAKTAIREWQANFNNLKSVFLSNLGQFFLIYQRMLFF